MGITNIKIPHWVVATFRALSFVAAIISLVTYSVYTAQVISGSRSSERYCLGIFGAAIIWVLTAAIQHWWKHRNDSKEEDGGKSRRNMKIIVASLIVLDLAFIALFIAASALLSPRGGSARGSGMAGMLRRDNDNEEDVDMDPHSGLVNTAFAFSIVNV